MKCVRLYLLLILEAEASMPRNVLNKEEDRDVGRSEEWNRGP